MAASSRVNRTSRLRSRSRAGFTLVEVMAVVVLVLLTATLAAPALMRTMSAERAQRATFDFARLARQARTESIAYGRAYVLLVDAATTGDELELWRGVTDSCRFNPWSAILVTNGCDREPRAADCVDSVDLADYNSSRQTIRLRTSGPTMICFEPDDEIWVSTTGATGLRRPTEAVTLTVQRFEGSTALESRRLLLPISGAPRVL